MAWPVAAALLSGGASLLGNIVNVSAAQNINRSQIEHGKETNQMNRELTEMAWSRDDNAAQRRVADLKAAGLSPTLAAGSPASVSNPITMQNPGANQKVPHWQNDAALAEIALSAMKQKADISLTNAERARVKAQTTELDLINRLRSLELEKFDDRYRREVGSYDRDQARYEREGRQQDRYYDIDNRRLQDDLYTSEYNRDNLLARTAGTRLDTEVTRYDFEKRLESGAVPGSGTIGGFYSTVSSVIQRVQATSSEKNYLQSRVDYYGRLAMDNRRPGEDTYDAAIRLARGRNENYRVVDVLVQARARSRSNISRR